MNRLLVLKAIADETRLELLTMLLKNNCCVRALARRLELTEGTVSQHLKVLRDAGLIKGEKRGYFMYYNVEHSTLRELAKDIDNLAAVEREVCTPTKSSCRSSEQEICRSKSACGKSKAKNFLC